MRPTIAFDQIRLLIENVENTMIENDFLKSLLDWSSVEDQFQAYKMSNRHLYVERFAPIRESLRQLAMMLASEDEAQNPPPTSRTN